MSDSRPTCRRGGRSRATARRLAAVGCALALLGSCANTDRYLPLFGRAQTLASPNGPVVFSLAPDGDVYYAELRTNDVYAVTNGASPRLVVKLDDAKPDSIAVDARRSLFVATRTKGTHRLQVRVLSPTTEDSGTSCVVSCPERAQDNARSWKVVWQGPVSRFAAHIALDAKRQLIVGLGNNLLSLDPARGPHQKPTVISDGWTDPVFAFGDGSRIWVADNALPGQKELVARGRERDRPKRRRFASALPPYTNPSGIAIVVDELLVCSRTHRNVYRLHIGIDHVARRRSVLAGLVCDRDIAAAADGSIITATTGAIYRYPPR